MIDRVLHIGHRFSAQYNKELLQQAAEIYSAKGPTAVAPFLTEAGHLPPAEAQTLAQAIDAEMKNINRQILLYYVVSLTAFVVIVWLSLRAEGYIFATLFALPALRILYSLIKFLRRHALH